MEHTGAQLLGERLALWSVFPFVGLLLSIAFVPLAAREFWHRHFGRLALAWTLAFAIPFVLVLRGEAVHAVLHTITAEYLPFIVLVGGLYTVSGGIVVAGTLAGSPLANAALLLVGGALASIIGTTGASMLLIRPLLRANAGRRRRAHQVVFFIFLVSNIGGSLTPLGDPPLFLGFLQGVPFLWTLHLLPHTALVFGLVLGIFLALDTALYYRERRERRRGEPPHPEPDAAAGAKFRLVLVGAHNLLYLACIVLAVLVSGVWRPGSVGVAGIEAGIQDLVRDSAILVMAFLSWRTTRREVRRTNGFSWFPLREVAILFAAIFVTMIPALAILRAGARGAMAPLVASVTEPAHYFWATGLVSSFLDNAPTYLSFLNLALGSLHPGMPMADGIHRLIAESPGYLEAISAGAVFMGANSYIGNAPNFMVAAIAGEDGVEMPSFLGYMLKYSIPVLVPVFWLMARLQF